MFKQVTILFLTLGASAALSAQAAGQEVDVTTVTPLTDLAEVTDVKMDPGSAQIDRPLDRVRWNRDTDRKITDRRVTDRRVTDRKITDRQKRDRISDRRLRQNRVKNARRTQARTKQARMKRARVKNARSGASNK